MINFCLQVFEPFGQVELVQLPLDPMTGLCKGYGFIQVSSSPEALSLIMSVFILTICCALQFARLEDAKAAQSLNGQLDIAGRVIKVTFHSSHMVYGTDNTWLTIVHPFNTLIFSLNQVSAVTDHVGVQVSGATTGDLDDDEGGGLVGELIWFNMLDNLI